MSILTPQEVINRTGRAFPENSDFRRTSLGRESFIEKGRAHILLPFKLSIHRKKTKSGK